MHKHLQLLLKLRSMLYPIDANFLHPVHINKAQYLRNQANRVEDEEKTLKELDNLIAELSNPDLHGQKET